MRDRILDAARELFLAHGYESVSMRKIADAIAYTPAALYVHFKDKEDLLRQMCRRDFGRLASVFNELAEVEDPIERIREIGLAYVGFALAYPNHYRLMFMTPSPGPIELEEEDLKVRGNPSEDSYAFLKLAVDQALAGGRFSPGLTDADLVTQTLWAAVHGVASLTICMDDDPWVECRPAERRTYVMVDAILTGLTAGSQRPWAPVAGGGA
ncbi:MAG TPA: TetR/AcrR family transcriptional regulator [Tepidisphaeraceae bacterium]|nr:TetR/AcrR family transcriptional regulator [Tepidisphaeraceae bacterium]